MQVKAKTFEKSLKKTTIFSKKIECMENKNSKKFKFLEEGTTTTTKQIQSYNLRVNPTPHELWKDIIKWP